MGERQSELSDLKVRYLPNTLSCLRRIPCILARAEFPLSFRPQNMYRQGHVHEALRRVKDVIAKAWRRTNTWKWEVVVARRCSLSPQKHKSTISFTKLGIDQLLRFNVTTVLRHSGHKL